ncbi:neuraminidase [Flavobacterium akiainvivens]|uniref:Neuraminidase n=2 Tax=Flavobacterium akiainvivens TaxID=1202724 RepID=A0A0M9VI79_9FLAO|nr:BNR repeat-containing protein [Flavobacterium akiainvivens]KOS06390.1 neuraminidase [Flavobacterium akiainvivens]SFQ14592.1 BNR repeat-containing family member [Flavobacterium akiainvivens]
MFFGLALFMGCASLKTSGSVVGEGWAGNSVNTVIFRNAALTSFGGFQFTAYYNNEGYVVLAKRKQGASVWQTAVTPYKGNIRDAHNCISMAIDSRGYLHLSWNHHDNPLHYARSTTPLGLELTEMMPMTGLQEDKVTYPQFYNLPNGNLLFCYRSGQSGRGNMVLNVYNPATQQWQQVQNNLLDGQGNRSAYWQMCSSPKGLYLSWTWRETWDVSTNHDICYAFSPDGGITWQKSDGTAYTLPITINNAEVVQTVPQNSSLINQTAMTVDAKGNPYIATYWAEKNATPQYKVVYFNGAEWNIIHSNLRTGNFNLGGGGTKSIPISRPELMVKNNTVYLLYRDEERGNKVSLAHINLSSKKWQVSNLTSTPVGQWEPNFDKELWAATGQLHIFAQEVNQADGEGVNNVPPTPVRVIEVRHLPR